MAGRVLIADDSLKAQKQLGQLLQEAGIEVVTVSNGEHAVRKLASVQPDLVLADIFMPVRSGYEVCEYVKNNEATVNVPVLLLASKLEPFDEKEAQRVGADGKLEKPFTDPPGTLAIIKQFLAKGGTPKPAPAPAAAPAAKRARAASGPPRGAPEPEPEPEFQPEPQGEAELEQFPSRPAPVTFEDQAIPLGFTDIVEDQKPATAPSESEGSVADLTQATVLSSSEGAAATEDRKEKGQRKEKGEKIKEEVRVEAQAAPAYEIIHQQQPRASPDAEPENLIERPELGAAWEMTGPEPGAPPIPPAGNWNTQWAEEESKPPASTRPPPAKEPAPVVDAPPPAPASPLGEFAAAFEPAAGESTRQAPAPVEEADAPAFLAAPASPPAIDPAAIDEVVNRVLKRLSPQVMETIAREIVRPLAEALVREKRDEE